MTVMHMRPSAARALLAYSLRRWARLRRVKAMREEFLRCGFDTEQSKDMSNIYVDMLINTRQL